MVGIKITLTRRGLLIIMEIFRQSAHYFSSLVPFGGLIRLSFNILRWQQEIYDVHHHFVRRTHPIMMHGRMG
jgi:hypothetical protein